MSPQPGLLVTVDGPGAAGKSTIITLLHTALAEAEVPVNATTQPSRTRLGDLARRHTHTYRGMALACLVAADRHHQLATEIIPAVHCGQVVLCDRYVPSSLVLQRMDGLTATQIWHLNAGTPVPDLAIILNADPAVLADRLHRRGGHSRFETTTSPDGRTSSEVESDLYELTLAELAQLGWPVLALDTTHTQPETMAADLTVTITSLYQQRSQQCLT